MRRATVAALAAAAVLLGGCAVETTAPEVVPDEPSTEMVPDEPPGETVPDEPPGEPAPDDPGLGLPPVADPLPLDQLEAFGGVATLDAGSNCTGTLVDTGVPDGPAYVLTNGHCAGGMDGGAQSTAHDQDWWGTAEFFRAAGNLDSTLTVDVVGLPYTTMRHTDTAVLRLDSTLGELEELGVRPVAVTDEEPAEGAEVVNVGVPVQNLPEDDWFLRRGGCTLGSQHTVVEFHWLWFDVWSTDCPGIIQGSSGSPLLELDADGAPSRVVAMINTTTWGAAPDRGGHCALNRPCQLEDGVAEMVAETSYAQSVAGVGRCFDGTSGEFVLDDDCPLPDSDVWALAGGGPFRGGDLPDVAGRLPEVYLTAAEAGRVRTTLAPLGDGTACLDPATYDDAETHEVAVVEHLWEDAAAVPVDLPEEEGWFAFCAVRGDGYDGAATVLFEVDRTPPVLAADAEIEEGYDGVLVSPHLDPPELAQVRFAWAPGDVACPEPETFEDFFVVPLHLTTADLPATYCIYGLDQAGNPNDVTRVPVAAP